MRNSAPGLLHHQSLFEWATSGLDEKISLKLVFDVFIKNRIKGSRQSESRGVRNVSICPNLSRTSAIGVLFSINFAVIFDFIYFRFRPSKAK
jgi:hypothetical protein